MEENNPNNWITWTITRWDVNCNFPADLLACLHGKEPLMWKTFCAEQDILAEAKFSADFRFFLFVFASMTENEQTKGMGYFDSFGNAVLSSNKKYLMVEVPPCDISSWLKVTRSYRKDVKRCSVEFFNNNRRCTVKRSAAFFFFSLFFEKLSVLKKNSYALYLEIDWIIVIFQINYRKKSSPPACFMLQD